MITRGKSIMTKDMFNETETSEPETSPVRENLKKAGKVVVAGLIGAGAIAGLVSGIDALIAGGVGLATVCGLVISASELASAGEKMSNLIANHEPQLQGA